MSTYVDPVEGRTDLESRAKLPPPDNDYPTNPALLTAPYPGLGVGAGPYTTLLRVSAACSSYSSVACCYAFHG